MAALTARQTEQLMHYREKATAWMFVATGAALIATKETWDLRETYEWSNAVFWMILVVMVVACTANTAIRVKRREEILERARAQDKG